MKAHGLDVIPNKDFWIGFPGLVKDGIMFAHRKITRKDAYQSV